MALAISGWLVGANDATDDFHVAVSLAEVRNLVRTISASRWRPSVPRSSASLADQPAATVPRVAQL